MSGIEFASGIYVPVPRGGGKLRDPTRFDRALPRDVDVPAALASKYALRPGAFVYGPAGKSPAPGQPTRLEDVLAIERLIPDDYHAIERFDDQTAIDPSERLVLETDAKPLGPRVVDMLAPIGRGQRGLIVAPPRTGKTILLRQFADAITKNHPEIAVFVLLVDERPEEVTETRRETKGIVSASSSDRDPEEHIALAELVFERCKRLAEIGRHVVLLLDSLTRLARAYNKMSNTGRTMTGGVDIKALDVPKRLFGSARTLEHGGSLTVLASVLVDTGSRMDELIFQEFKGTGNMELVLDRKLADRRVWPAVDIAQSGTRKEERLLVPETLAAITLLRRTLADMDNTVAIEKLVEQLEKHPTNAAFLERIGSFKQ